MIRLGIFKEAPVTIPRMKIEKLFKRIAAKESRKYKQGKVNLIFVDDKMIRKLNKIYRNKNKATDVLSFNIETGKSDRSTIGEIYISKDTATKQARQFDTTLQNEILRLVCHGLLHIFGYDHIKNIDRIKMETKEASYLKAVGVVR